jgi:hypothetical protein
MPAAGALILLMRHGREPAEIIDGPAGETRAARVIRRDHPSWWVRPTALR